MPETPEQIALSKRQQALSYQEELKRKRLYTVLGYSGVVVVTFFFIMILSGNMFSGILGIFGLRALRNDEAGIYADCSRPENRSSPYCQPKVSERDKEWKGMTQSKGSFVPFSLSSD